MRPPVSTYRLQIHAGFDLDSARSVIDYVGRLGADWIYLSPLLEAAPGSTHGYDVVDHATVDRARGGEQAFRRLADAAHAAGLGVLVDIVPNHMGVEPPASNAMWWDVLARGPGSAMASAFDIDWDAGGGKLRIPVLGDEAEPMLRVEGSELRYHEHRFPLAGSDGDGEAMPGRARSAADVHAAQHYELVNWRRADTDLNYRRFFAVNSLAGVRVEDRHVFERSHAEIGRWVHDGLADGLRVDHPDGLADPARYLDELAEFTGVEYVVVEKILVGRERMPPGWAAAGTTGYDALADIDRVLIDPCGETELSGEPPLDWEELIHTTKRAVADGILQSEVRRLARELVAGGLDDGAALTDGLAELLACFPVYRSYLPYGAEQLDSAAERARRWRPDLAATLGHLQKALSDPSNPAAIRFQQTSGMVMAKGVEDCAFYRFNRLGSLTEVGGDPSEFAISVDEFHRRQQRRHVEHPHGLTALTTHDTKRSEDTRARISVLAEIAGEWRATLARLTSLIPLPDPPLAQLLWQAIVGSWPASSERLHAYAAKAAREAGTSTTWADPDHEFEMAMHRMIDHALTQPEAVRTIEQQVAAIRDPGWSNSLSAKLLQLTGPGVPDVYQGTELWDMSLVDPDNRRPVDFDQRRSMLLGLGTSLPPVDATGAAKLLVTTRALRVRRDNPHLFSDYAPLDPRGDAAAHAIAVDRGGVVAVATRLPMTLQRTGGWRDTALDVGRRPRIDVITGRRVEGGTIAIAELLDTYPVALLAPVDVVD